VRHPSFEPRRRKELLDAILARARTWIADWQPRDEGDFATALFAIAARLESEVTQRLDRVPEKTFRGFLDWLGVTGKPGLAARLPVVFKMTPGSDPVDAPERAQLQINVGDTPVNFESERPLRVLPGTLATVVAVNPRQDAFYTPPADIVISEPPRAEPRSWRLKSEAPADTKTLQLDPPLGLERGLTLSDPSGQQYDIDDAQGGIVTIDRPLATTLDTGDEVTRLDRFTPFSPTERNRQEHAFYIGSDKGLNIEAPALIAVRGGAGIPNDATWWYSGKSSPTSPIDWLPITKVEIDGNAVVLDKPLGAIETMKIDGYQSRWLRATRAAGVPQSSHIVGGVRLAVNCLPKGRHGPTVTALEGIANTTPLVLDAGFYPFGREPRQFDSFYLGSKEAFSKASAEVTLDFTLGSAVPNARAVVGLNSTESRSYGVGDDGRLHRIEHVVSSGQPTAEFLPPTQPGGTNKRPIPLNTAVRPSGLLYFLTPLVLAAAGHEVWLLADSEIGQFWTLLDTPFAAPDGTTPDVTGLMFATAASGVVAYAVSGGKLHRRDVVAGGAWAEEAIGLPQDEQVVLVLPVNRIGDLPGSQRESDGVVVVNNLGDIYLRDNTGAWTLASGGPALDTTFYPVVVLTASGERLCLARDEEFKQPSAFDLAQIGIGFWAPVDLLGHTLDFVARGDEVVAAMLAADPANNQPPAIAVWDAFNNAEPVFDDQPSQPVLAEGPLRVGRDAGISYVLSAGKDGEAFILPVGQIELVSGAHVGDVIVFTDATDWGAHTNPIIIDTTPTAPANSDRDVVDVLLVGGSTATHWVMDTSETIADGAIVRLHASMHPGLLNGTAGNLSITLDTVVPDTWAADNGLLYITAADGVERIVPIGTVAAGVATIPAGVPWAPGTAVQYRNIQPGIDRTVIVRPTVELPGLDSSLVAALGQATLEFESPIDPPTQTVTDVVDAGNVAVLSDAWATPPSSTAVDFLVTLNLFDTWSVFEPPKPRNPTLSWEYFDGTAWRLIPTLEDHTDELATGGEVIFCVPTDLQPTDVAGRKNHWIRARLVGGDYGQETVTVVSVTAGGKTTQTVERNTDSIHAPYVARLTVTYKVCCEVMPDVVLTRDNGSLLNQTDVNRSPGAVVDYFVPLSEALNASDRALYLGFDTKLAGGPIQVLFLVNDGSHDEAFPLRVDALSSGGFKPLVVKDNTRGLNESGTIEMDLAESPQLTELFGTTKHWLRVRPGPRLADEGTWQPSIRAAYLNATWATAAETQRFEQLGSSDGSPGQRFALARPPVIEGSLKLRVLERLGDEDIDRLRRDGFDIAETFPNVPKRQGCWVLWNEVVDPADEPPDARVFALDETTDATSGETTSIIRFGDGLHGMIPPIGTNTILAEEYRRGGGEAANRVTAWSQINLVTPLSGVNTVFAPDGAAGGSDPQDAEATMRFAPVNLRLRDRALTRADFEMLTLQFSRDIAQARALSTATGLRLIVVMRGRVAQPGAGILRELRTYLESHSLPSLTGKDVLRIEGPKEVPIRIALELVVDDIAWGGEVARNARQAIEQLLDPATGGHQAVGFALGEIPSQTDITAALVGIRHVEEIRSATATRVDGSPLGTLTPSELVRVIPDGVTVDVRLETEVTA
jgi:hypothetical protein